MAKIRDDLDGVVYLDDGRKLEAGDTVPDGVELGDHVLEDAAGESRRRRAEAAKAKAGADAAKGDGNNAARNQS